MILDAADAWNVLGDDAERPSFLLRSNGPPEMHDAVQDDDIDSPGLAHSCRRSSASNRSRMKRSLSSLALAAPLLANTCSRSARLTMATIFPSCTTGTRLIRLVSISSAISPKLANSPTLTTSRVMTSSTRRACDLMYSAAIREFAENHSLQGERRRSVPVSARRSKSPSVMIPTSCPFLSRTGTPLMRRLIMSLATSWIVVSRVVVATALYMTSLALIRLSSCWGKLHSQTTQALDLDQRDSRSRLEYQIPVPDYEPVVHRDRSRALRGRAVMAVARTARARPPAWRHRYRTGEFSFLFSDRDLPRR